MLMQVLNAFAAYNAEMPLFIALPLPFIQHWKSLCKDYSYHIPHQVITGGQTRFHSVRNALNYIPDDCLVAIHDGVRPLISRNLISHSFAEAALHGNAIPVLAVNESLRMIIDATSKPADRSMFRIVQTPQVFQATLIKKAYDQEYQTKFTDDATVFESFGEKLHLVDGEPGNIKITYPVDLLFAEAIFLPFQEYEKRFPDIPMKTI